MGARHHPGSAKNVRGCCSSHSCVKWLGSYKSAFKYNVECLATENLLGSGPLTDIAVWEDGR